MKVIAVVGSSGSGKTRLIRRLVAEFKKRKSRPAVIKHCPHGFRAEAGGKDSLRFIRAGAAAAAVVGPGGRAVMRREASSPDLFQAAAAMFLEADVVLIEGGSRAPGLKKIEVRRKGIPAKPVGPAEDIVAFISESRFDSDKPVFRPSDISRIAGFISREASIVGPDLRLEVDGRDIPLSGRDARILRNMILSRTASLSGVSPRPRSVLLALKRSGHAAQKN